MSNNCLNVEYNSNTHFRDIRGTIIVALKNFVENSKLAEEQGLPAPKISDYRNRIILDISKLNISYDTSISKSEIIKDVTEIFSKFIEKRSKEDSREKLSSDLQTRILNILKQIIENINKVSTLEENKVIDEVPELTTNKENSDEVKNELTIKQFEKSIYKNAISPRAYRLSQFARDIVLMCIVDTKSRKIIKNNRDLNAAIMDYKNRLYQHILNYLKSIGINGLPEYMFSEDTEELNTLYMKTLNIFYEHLKGLKNIDLLLTRGWVKLISGNDDLLYLATNAYVNIFYFDKLLRNTIGKKIINIAKDVNGVEIDANFLKYTFSEKAAELAKGWETQENRDALEDTSKFSKLIIESIPMKSFSKKKEYPFSISLVSFTTAFTNLESSIMNAYSEGVKVNPKLLDLLNKYHSQPKEYIVPLLKEFLSNSTAMKRRDITQFDIDVLYSVYDYVFDPNNKNSIDNIETNFIKNSFTLGTALFPIVECILGVIDRVKQINYMESSLDDDGNPSSSIKSKFPSRLREYNIRNSINFDLIGRRQSSREVLLNKYQFERKNASLWKLKIGGFTYELNSAGSRNLFISTFDKIKFGEGTTIPKFNNDDISELLNPDLSTKTDDQLLLLSIIKFIDDNLFPLKFLSQQGLEKLMLAQQLDRDENIIKKLFIAAARNCFINKIYSEYNTYSEENLDSSKLNFYSYASSRYPELLLKNMDDPSKSKNILSRGLGTTNILGVRIYDDWVNTIVTAEMIITGDISKANTKDLFGHSIGNYSTAFLGANLMYYLFLSRNEFNLITRKWEPRQNSALGKLLFATNQALIRKVVVNTDALSKTGDKKTVRNMNPGELIHQSIFHNFWETMLNTDEKDPLKNSYVILPTTYSDKTKIIKYVINANGIIDKKNFPIYIQNRNRSYIGKSLKQLNLSELEDLYYDTIGEYYKLIYANTISKLENTFGVLSKEEVLRMFNYINSLSKDQVIAEAEARGIKIYDEEGYFREEYLIKLALSKGILLGLDSDYRIKGGKLYFNELLDYNVNYLFKDQLNLRSRLESEKINFLNDIIDSNNIFYTQFLDGSETEIYKIINKLFGVGNYSSKNVYSNKALFETLNLKEGESILSKYLNTWVKDKKLILAKSKTREYVYGDKIPEGTDIVINPLLEFYFMLDSLLSNNLRFSLTGTELAHPIKTKDKELNSLDISVEGFLWDRKNAGLAVRLESLAQGALLKRNVIIPGTLQYLQLGNIRGILSKLRMAVIRDLLVPTFNFRGDIDWIKSSDGAALVNPFASILENNSLQDQKVGDDKKTILHSMDCSTGAVVLGKWATFAITNDLMNQSLNSEVNLYNVFKKLTNMQWIVNGAVNSEFIDTNKMKGNTIDLSQVRGATGLRNIDFGIDILHGKLLLYEDELLEGNTIIKSIVNFGRDEIGYYTDEEIVSAIDGSAYSNTKKRIYHLYDLNSNHIRATKEELEIYKDRGVHTINSLFELHAALGGLNSVEFNEDGDIRPSESSNYAVVEFMNAFAIQQTDNRGNLCLNNYYQPLKDLLIGYAANNTSIKNGAANINQSESWKNDDDFTYMVMNYDGIGVLMDADHEADEALLTEFSLVISALDAGGKMHSVAKKAYECLRQIAELTSITELLALDAFVYFITQEGIGKPQAINQMYDIVARTIINNIASDKNNNEANLSDEIVDLVEKHINDNLLHLSDEYKIPFSDPGIYNKLLPTFVSVINKKSVKRKYPGSGYVMHPSFGFVQLYDINGVPHQFADIYNLHKNSTKRLLGESLVQYKLRVVRNFLEQKLAEQLEKQRSDFNPIENVLVKITDNTTNKEYTINVSLADPSNYVIFKQDYWSTLIIGKKTDKGTTITLDLLNNSTIKFYNNVMKGRDLAPTKITWTENGVNHNVFDEEPIQKSFTDILIYNNGVEYKKVIVPKGMINNPEKIKKFINNTLHDIYIEDSIKLVKGVANRSEILKLFYQLSEGNINGRVVENLSNNAAEIILSSMNRSKYPEHSSLPLVLKSQEFRISPIHTIPGIDKYDLAIVKNNKKHSFITFNKLNTNPNDSNAPIELNFRYKKPVLTKGGKILIYSMTEDSVLQFPIAAGKVRDDLKFDDEGRVIYKNLNKEAEGKFIRGEKNEVIEQQDLVKKYKVIHHKTAFGRDIPVEQIVYHVNQDLIDSYGLRINDILSNIFELEKGLELKVNTKTKYDKEKIYNAINNMHFDNSYMLNHLENVKDVLKTGDTKLYKRRVEEFYSNMSTAIRSSFLRLLEITSSRIPAQTLLSFMQCLTVGYTNVKNNICFVTPWQLFLLGSDYDIDKAYIMGCEIDDNGLYVGWSPLFDYFSVRTLKNSELIPFPAMKSIIISDEENAIDITQQLNNIIGHQTLLELAQKTSPTTVEEKIERRKLIELARIDRQNAYIELIEIINNVGSQKVNIKISDELLNGPSRKIVDRILNNIHLHQFYKMSESKREASTRNSVSSKINIIVQDLKNMDSAYSPIEMSHIRPEESSVKVISLINPMSKYIMQHLNMVGKGVIGIAATGEKIFFNLTYYFNERLRKGRRVDLLDFSKTFDRIQGRYRVQKGIQKLNEDLKGVFDPDVALSIIDDYNNDESILHSPESVTKTMLANVNFDFKRVERFRNKINKINEIYELTLTDLPGVDPKSEQFLKLFHERIRYQQDGEPSMDLYISELLSAATDNAKELILALINAGTDLAGNYLYLLSMGFEIKDIIAFMTSPAINTVSSLSKFNIFNDRIRALNINDIVLVLRGDLSKLYLGKDKISSIVSDLKGSYASDLYPPLHELGDEKETNEQIIQRYIFGLVDRIIKEKISIDDIKKPNSLTSSGQYDFFKLIIQKIVSNIKESKSFGFSDIISDFYNDIEEFNKILIGVQEQTNLGTVLLSLNQGIPSSQIDLLTKIKQIRDIVRNREKMYGINKYWRLGIVGLLKKKNIDFADLENSYLNGDLDIEAIINALQQSKSFINTIDAMEKDHPYISRENITRTLAYNFVRRKLSDGNMLSIASEFDPREWLVNEDYREQTIEYYNILKDTFNPFDVVKTVPQYRSLIKLLGMIYQFNDKLSAKSRAVNMIHKRLIAKDRFLDEQKLNGILNYVDDRIIISWIENQDQERVRNFRFPILLDEQYLDSNKNIVTSLVLKSSDLTTAEGRASFKYMMENYLIPKLQESTVPNVRISNNNAEYTGELLDLRDNEFIKGLVRSLNREGVPFYMLDINMLTFDKTPALQEQYLKYLDGLIELKNYTYGGLTLSDLFMMYNLIVNKNMYGESRMTSIFRSFIQVVEEDTLMKQYYKYIGDLDFESEEDIIEKLDIDFDDLELYMAKLISKNLESIVKDNYIKEIEEDGFPIYKRRNKNGGYEVININPVRRLMSKNNESVSVKANNILYFLMKSPNVDNKRLFMEKLLSTDENDILEALQILQSEKIISLTIGNCK